MKIHTKLSILFFAFSLGVVLAVGIFSSLAFEQYLRSHIINELQTQVNQVEFVLRTMAAHDVDRYGHLQQFVHAANLRLTLVDTEGKVLFESDLPHDRLSTLENHLQRPEVQEALRLGTGVSMRHSSTLDTDMLYLAKKLSDPFLDESMFKETSVIRLGIPLSQVNAVIGGIRSN